MPEDGDKSKSETWFDEQTVVISKDGVELECLSDLPGSQQPVLLSKSIDVPQNESPASLLPGFKKLSTESERQFYFKRVRNLVDSVKYLVCDKIVEGGMGAIYRAIDQDLTRESAMKVVLPQLKDDQLAMADFVREAKITGLLEHPNIVPLHELGMTSETGMFFTMKLAKGKALNCILDKIRQQDEDYTQHYTMFRLLTIFRKVCDAVSFAHSRDIVHQDIKPHNVMVGRYGEVLLMDWGIARYIGDPDKEKNPIRRKLFQEIVALSTGRENYIQGSPNYMAPEQVLGDISLVDKYTDIYLLGATLYHMATLYPPYVGTHVNEIMEKAEKRDLIPPEERNPERGISQEISYIIMKAMARNKSDRYQTVDALIKDIDSYMAGEWMHQQYKWFAPGEMLMREGEPGEEAYVILKGKVEVFTQHNADRIVFGTLKEGDIVGEMALISKEPRSANVQAIERTKVAVLTKHVLLHNLKKLPPFMEKIVSNLAGRLRAANTRINIHSTTDCTYVVLEQLRLIFRDRSNTRVAGFALPLKELVREISENLGIPDKRVRSVIKKAAMLKLIQLNEMGQVKILDMPRMIQFANFARMTSKIPLKHRKILLKDYIRKHFSG